MKVLNEREVNELRNKYLGYVGKNVSVVVTGERVNGVVKKYNETEHSFELVVDHKPVTWGNDTYTTSTIWARKCDNWGSMKNLEVVE